jgi:hypothetical protein
MEDWGARSKKSYGGYTEKGRRERERGSWISKTGNPATAFPQISYFLKTNYVGNYSKTQNDTGTVYSDTKPISVIIKIKVPVTIKKILYRYLIRTGITREKPGLFFIQYE